MSWNAEAIINESHIDDVFESVYSTIIRNIQKSLENYMLKLTHTQKWGQKKMVGKVGKLCTT